MSNKLFLSLGDIIQISAPANLEINDKIFLIGYLDNNIIKLIDAASESTAKLLELNINDGKLSEESIEEIAILNHAGQKGFARQQQLLPQTWIDIYFGGDVPAVLTGEIVGLEEDMIEIETYPDKQKIFIDFAYKGIPLDLPISQITIRESPLKALSPSLEAEYVSPVEEVPPDLSLVIEEADEIIFGAEEYMVQIVDVPEAEKRFGIAQQSVDLLDELLASIPTNKRTNAVLNNIHIMIERFKQLRKMYSIFNEYGSPEGPLIKGSNYKPLVETLKKLNQNLYWILPIVKNRKKLYDIIDNDFDDIIALTLGETREDFYTLLKNFKQNAAPGDENKYDYLMDHLRSFMLPFERTRDMDTILITQEVSDNYNTIVNNLEDYESTVFGVENLESFSAKQPPMTHNMRFAMSRYIQGLTKLISADKRNKRNKKNLTRVQLTPNDTMDIQSFMMLPPPIVQYSKINLPETSILQKAQLHMVNMYYYQLLQQNTTFRAVNVEDNNYFLKGIRAPFYTNEELAGEEKYNFFLNQLVPKTKDIFNLFKRYIKNGHSYMKIISQLEPFMIYGNDITYKQYEAIVSYMDQINIQWMKEYIINGHQIEKYQNIKYRVNIQEDTFFIEKELYHFPPGFISSTEMINKMLYWDGARVFTLLLSLEDINLHVYVDIEEQLEGQISAISERLQGEEANNTCKEYILSKKYLELDEVVAENNKEIFFDKQFDITRYGLLDEMKKQRAQMEPEQFKQFLTEHLLNNVGMQANDVAREVDALLKGNRRVVEGDYAMLSLEDTDAFKYYKRVNEQWVEEEEDWRDRPWTEIFCNLQKKCLRVKEKCNDMNINKSLIEKELLKEMLEHFDNNTAISQERLQGHLSRNLAFYSKQLASLIILHQQEETQYEVEKLKIGFTSDIKEQIVSPYARMRDLILSQPNFPKKQQDIKIFVARFCRIGVEPDESPYWYYDAKLSVPLLPTFFKLLADAFEANKYEEVLAQVVAERGALSDSGDAMVDKYSGYEIKKMDYVILEEYDETGFRILSRDLLESSIGDTLVQGGETKKYASKDSQMISNVVHTMSRFLTVPLDSQMEYIIKNVSDILSKIIPSKTRYEKLQKAKKAKKGKKSDSYERIKNSALLMLTLCYIILSIQTMIPSPRTAKTFPGCRRSFKGYPYDGDGNQDFLNYISCIIYNIKLDGQPWINLKRKRKKKQSREDMKRENIKGLTNNLVQLFKKTIIDREETKARIQAKQEFLSTQMDIASIAEEHQITAWTTFLPPLRLIHIDNLRNVSSAFISGLESNLTNGNIDQFEKLSTLKGKIILYSLAIQQTIQRVINKSHPLLTNAVDEPFLENVCCNIGLTNTIEYFSSKEPSIQKHNNIVKELSSIVEKVRWSSYAAYLYDREDTRLVYPPVTNIFTEKTIYKAFIRYCRFNSGAPLPENLQHICVDNNSVFLFTDTFEEKMRILKQEGKHYGIEQFYQLLMIIERQNIIPMDLQLHIVSARAILEGLLDALDERDIVHPLLTFYRETLDYVDIQETETQEITGQMSTYLSLAIPELRNTIYTFIQQNASITGQKLKELETILNTLGIWETRGKGIYMSPRDETHFFSATFFKNNIFNIANVYPSIILDKVNYNKVNVPQHWHFGIRHQRDIQTFISKEYQSLRRFYDNPHLSATFREVHKNTRNILRIINAIPFFAKTQEANILFGGAMFNNLMEFYYLSTLHAYIENKEEVIVLKSKKGGGGGEPEYASPPAKPQKRVSMRELEIEQGQLQVADQALASLLVQFLLNFQKHKQTINFNNETIEEKALKSRETEKNKMTRELGNLAPAEREVEDLMKNHRLGKWSVGLTRALFEYDEGQYEKEQREIERDILLETQLNQMKGVNPQNKNILKLDAIAEQRAEADAWKEAYDISDLPDDE